MATQDSSSLETLETLEWGPSPGRVLVVGLHGRGSTPRKLEPHAPRATPGAHHVIPRGLFPWEDGAAWYQGRPAPLEELDRSVAAVQSLLQRFWSQGHRPARTLVWGFSQGAMLAMQLSVLLDEPFAGTVAIGAKMHGSLAGSPALLAPARDRRFLFIHGRTDTVIPPEDGEAAFQALARAGARAEWLEHPAAHVLSPFVDDALQRFAFQVLGD